MARPYSPPTSAPLSGSHASTLWTQPNRCNSVYAAMTPAWIQWPPVGRGPAHAAMTSSKAVSTRIS